MFYNKEISIINDTGHMNENEKWIEGEKVVVKTIECDVQPFNKELAFKDYNITEDIKYRVFCDPDPLIKNATQMSYREQFKEEDTIFNVVKIIQWDDYWILLIDN